MSVRGLQRQKLKDNEKVMLPERNPGDTEYCRYTLLILLKMRPQSKTIVGYIVHYQYLRRDARWYVYGGTRPYDPGPQILTKTEADAKLKELRGRFKTTHRYKAVPVYLINFISDETE